MRGYFGIGVYHPKTEENVGTLWRSAYLYGAGFIFTIGKRYKKQASDTVKTHRHIPLFNYLTHDEMMQHLPYAAQLVCVELSEIARPLPTFCHPQQAVYLLGAEDHGLPEEIIRDKIVIQLPTAEPQSMNVAVAGSIVMYDRFTKAQMRESNSLCSSTP